MKVLSSASADCGNYSRSITSERLLSQHFASLDFAGVHLLPQREKIKADKSLREIHP